MTVNSSLRELCVYNLLGTEQLQMVMSEDPSASTIPLDLKEEMLPIIAKFRDYMGSQKQFLRAIADKDHPRLALFLMKKYPEKLRDKIDHIERDGHTVLHAAAQNGNRELVEYLITVHHADPNAVAHDGDTILHAAALSGNRELVAYLTPLVVRRVDSKTCKVGLLVFSGLVVAATSYVLPKMWHW